MLALSFRTQWQLVTAIFSPFIGTFNFEKDFGSFVVARKTDRPLKKGGAGIEYEWMLCYRIAC